MKTAFFALVLAGCCHDVFCRDTLTVRVSSASMLQAGHWSFALDDGSRSWTIECDFNGVTPTCGDTGPAPANQVKPTIRAVGETWSIELAEAPQQLDVTVSRDGTMLSQDSFHPAYQVNQPNGPTCSPTCRSASVDVSIP
jgi:hypothetical protein